MKQDPLTELLPLVARLDERTMAIAKDVTEIKTRHQANTEDIGSLKDSRAKARGVLWVLGAIVALVGGERAVSWFNLPQ